MDAIWQWGLGVVVAIQELRSPVLDALMRILSLMGEEEFYLLILPLLAWCVEFGVAIRVTAVLLLSFTVNGMLKDAIAHPRPFDLDPAVRLSSAEGGGLPSGHAQSAVVLWGGLTAWARRPWVWVAAVALAGLIGLSRIYLGMHFPTDVIGGWMVGAAILTASLWTLPRFGPAISRWRPGPQVLLAITLPAGIAFLYATADAISAMGALAGMVAGVVAQTRTVPFTTRGPLLRRLLRFVVGTPIALGIYIGLRAVFPADGEAFYLPLRFVRYGLLGTWISLGAPWLFTRLGLASGQSMQSGSGDPSPRRQARRA